MLEAMRRHSRPAAPEVKVPALHHRPSVLTSLRFLWTANAITALLYCFAGEEQHLVARAGCAVLTLTVLLGLVHRSILFPAGPLQPTSIPHLAPDGRGPFAVPGLDQSRRALLDYLTANLRPDETVFFTLPQHRRLTANEADLYFYLDHPAATRYLQYDPNIVTRADVQLEMIAALERHATRLVVRTPPHLWSEPNQSQRNGAALLDEYLDSHYQPIQNFGSYRVLLRTPFI